MSDQNMNEIEDPVYASLRIILEASYSFVVQKSNDGPFQAVPPLRGRISERE